MNISFKHTSCTTSTQFFSIPPPEGSILGHIAREWIFLREDSALQNKRKKFIGGENKTHAIELPYEI
jgi:hypothetical protein